MSISVAPPPPPVASKKKGFGCLGCGCVLVVLIVLLIVALVVGGSYFGYNRVVSLTSTAPAEIPAAQGSNDLFQATEHKIGDFIHDIRNHQAAKMSLSADEINALIAHSPELAAQKAKIYVSLNDDRMRIQASVPTGAISSGIIKDRYANIDVTLSPQYDLANKSLSFHLYSALIGDQPTPENMLPVVQAEVTPLLNTEIRKSTDGAALLDQSKSIEVRDGELDFETQ
jgi:hypothetical protein